MRSNVPLVNPGYPSTPGRRTGSCLAELDAAYKRARSGSSLSDESRRRTTGQVGAGIAGFSPDLPAGSMPRRLYVGSFDSGRGPVAFPTFSTAPEDARPELEVEVDERDRSRDLRRRRASGSGPAELAGDAILAYLAELDLVGEPERPDRG